MDRVRKLFRESTYYHQLQLIRSINIQREYPIDHIYAALTYMIENRNELLVDSWGRNGYLVNHGDVYLFQPIEITDETVSLYDRNVPVEYRRDRISLDVPDTIIPLRTDVLGPDTGIVPNVVSSTNVTGTAAAAAAAAAVETTSIEDRLETLQSNVNRAMGREPSDPKQKDWYSYAATVFGDEEWKKDHRWKDADLEQMIVVHAIESLMPKERLSLVTESAATGNKILQAYLGKQWVASKLPGDSRHGWWILMDGDIKSKEPIQLFVSPHDGIGTWSKAEPEDINRFPLIQKPPPERLTEHVGFFSMFKNEMVFKTLNTTIPRHKGASVTSAGKQKIINLLNDVQNEVNYTDISTKDIHQKSVCAMLEVLMRRPRADGKIAFLNPEEAIL
jgi:hypothetical protein